MTGAFGAFWANVDYHSYHEVVEVVLIDHSPIGHLHDGHRTLTLHYLINDVLMAFFAMAGKEVWEAIILKMVVCGRKGLTPLIATAGGMLGPIGVYLVGHFLLVNLLFWQMGGRSNSNRYCLFLSCSAHCFRLGHPAVGFLLLLAIADDAAGLIILAVFYPQGDLATEWLLLSVGAAFAVYVLANRLPRMLDGTNEARPYTHFAEKLGFWPYLIAAVPAGMGSSKQVFTLPLAFCQLL